MLEEERQQPLRVNEKWRAQKGLELASSHESRLSIAVHIMEGHLFRQR